MANALDAVMALRQSKIDQNNLQNQQVQHALGMLQQAKQFNAQQQLQQLNTKVSAAQSGLQIGPGGSITYDSSLVPPWKQMIAQGQLGDALNKMREAGFLAPGAGNVSPTQGAPSIPQSNPNLLQKYFPSMVSNSVGSGNSGPMTVMGQTLNVAGVPTETKLENTGAELQKAADTKKVTDLASAQSAADIGTNRDAANLAMIAGESRNLMNYYDQADKEGLAGSKLNEWKAEQALNPLTKTTGQMAAPQGAQGAAGFQSAQNAFITRLEPIFQEQFGKEASSRILQSLIEMGQKEIGDLSNPRDVVAGKINSTIDSAYRMLKAGQNYSNNLNGDNLAQKVLDNWKSIQLSPEETQKLQAMKDYATAKNVNSYKSGITKKIGNTTYVRQENGTWQPQS